jgi:hypothetical protein
MSQLGVSTLRGPLALQVLLEFLVRDDGVSRQRLGAIVPERPLQFPVAELGSILIRDALYGKRLIEDGEAEFPRLLSGVENAVEVFAATFL